MRRTLLFMVAASWVFGALSGGTAYGQAADNGVGYASPGAALEALHQRPDVQFSVQNGWTIAADRENHTLWSFAPPDDPAYPTAVKRQVVQINNEIYVATSILCDGPQPACTRVAQEFQALNQQMKQTVRPSP